MESINILTKSEKAAITRMGCEIEIADLCDKALETLFEFNGNRYQALDDMIGYDDSRIIDMQYAMDLAMVVYARRASEIRRTRKSLDNVSESYKKENGITDELIWVLELQCTSRTKRIIKFFSSEEKLDAYAVEHDPSIHDNINVGYTKFFVPFFRKYPAVFKRTVCNARDDGTPIYGIDYEYKKAKLRAVISKLFAEEEPPSPIKLKKKEKEKSKPTYPKKSFPY